MQEFPSVNTIPPNDNFEPEKPLDLNSCQEIRLFYDSNWPMAFRESYANAKTHTERAKVAADRIDHFIKTEGI